MASPVAVGALVVVTLASTVVIGLEVLRWREERLLLAKLDANVPGSPARVCRRDGLVPFARWELSRFGSGGREYTCDVAKSPLILKNRYHLQSDGGWDVEPLNFTPVGRDADP